MSIGYTCAPDEDITLILSHFWTPIGITSAKDSIRKLFRNSYKDRAKCDIFAIDSNYNIKNWNAWITSCHSELFVNQPYMRSAKYQIPVPTILLTTSKWVYKCVNKPSVKYLYKRYKGICQICGERKLQSDMTLEHILPKSLHGTNDDFNLTLTCFDCNNKRGNQWPSLNYHGNELEAPKNINNVHVFSKHREEWKHFGVTVCK